MNQREFFPHSSMHCTLPHSLLWLLYNFFSGEINSYFGMKKIKRQEKMCKNINSILLRYSLRFTWNKIYIFTTPVWMFFLFFVFFCFVKCRTKRKKFYWKLCVFFYHCHLFRFVIHVRLNCCLFARRICVYSVSEVYIFYHNIDCACAYIFHGVHELTTFCFFLFLLWCRIVLVFCNIETTGFVNSIQM